MYKELKYHMINFKTVLHEFINSDFWKDVRTKVLATITLSGTGTSLGAITPSTESPTSDIITMLELFQLVSYGVSILIGITVLCRFFIFLKDRKKGINSNT